MASVCVFFSPPLIPKILHNFMLLLKMTFSKTSFLTQSNKFAQWALSQTEDPLELAFFVF